MSADFVNEEAVARSGEKVDFSFGANWQKFIETVDEHRIALVCESLVASFAGESLEGLGFLDLGCGSGLFSLAALRLGADPVISVDIDPLSVACATALRAREGYPPKWRIVRGSILDDAFVASLPRTPRLFSWGVLHHTGAMWDAIANALSLVEHEGCACIALYNLPRHPRFHMALKRVYNHAPRPLRPAMVGASAAANLTAQLVIRRSNPLRFVQSYAQNARGMSYLRDLEDWLGGLPCEFAEPPDVKRFLSARGFELERTRIAPPKSCNEYLCRRVT